MTEEEQLRVRAALDSLKLSYWYVSHETGDLYIDPCVSLGEAATALAAVSAFVGWPVTGSYCGLPLTADSFDVTKTLVDYQALQQRQSLQDQLNWRLVQHIRSNRRSNRRGYSISHETFEVTSYARRLDEFALNMVIIWNHCVSSVYPWQWGWSFSSEYLGVKVKIDGFDRWKIIQDWYAEWNKQAVDEMTRQVGLAAAHGTISATSEVRVLATGLYVLPGCHIDAACSDLLALAETLGRPLSVDFNGVSVVANPGDTAAAMVAAWRRGYALRWTEPARLGNEDNGGEA